jgi:beta-lactamase regulating signal transducer with metallopeptidase domain
MITTLMLYALAVGVLVAVGAVVLDRAARAAKLPQRFTWLGALALLAALTIAAPWRMAPVASPSVSVAPAAAAIGEAVTLPAAPWHERTLSFVQSAFSGGISALGARVPVSVDRMIGAAWGASALLMLALLAYLLRRLDVQRRRWPRAQLLGTAVRVGDREGPAVYGLFAPDIVIPRALLARDATDQALVLAHEDEHRRAHDPLLLATAAALVALMPWHPIAWWCVSRLRLATELDCDARVLRRGVSTRQYGEVLLTLASSLPAVPRAAHALGLFDSRRHLERRLLAMTTPITRRSPLAVGGFVLLGTVLFAAACNTDVPTAAEVRDADVTAVTKSLGLPSTPGAVTYVVDEVRLSELEARAIPAEEIASIEVLRRSGAEGANEVRILTRKAAAARGDLVEVPVEGRSELKKRAFTVQRADSSIEVPVEGTTERKKLAFTVQRADSSYVERPQVVRATADSISVRGDSILLAGNARVMLRNDGTAGDTVRELVVRRPYLVEERANDGQVIVRGTQSASAAQPLIIIDGVIATVPNALQNIKPDQIDRIEVIKGDAAKRLYGTRGADGVIKVTTKP